ncbi:histone-lysine N-methyltransferase SETMAR [Trichonephila clavipes]|nr:histone-lysine N-methyltransferase SETMAR [Trichonephila clavipes]
MLLSCQQPRSLEILCLKGSDWDGSEQFGRGSGYFEYKYGEHLELLPHVQTLNSDLYCQQLDRLKLAIDQKWAELANKRGVVFHQDNARRHTSVVTRQKFRELSLEVLKHLPHSLDPAPSDYHLFLALQNFLSDKKLGSREDCENPLPEFFNNKGQDFYKRGIMKLPLKWQQIILQNDAYLNQIGQSEAC